MDWSNEPYVRRSTRARPTTTLVLSWEARAVWDRLLTRFDRSGLLRNEARPDAVSPPARESRRRWSSASCPSCYEDGRLVEVDGGYMAPNFIAAQEATKSDKLRQRESRERRSGDRTRRIA
jgi:hypothetical protein